MEEGPLKLVATEVDGARRLSVSGEATIYAALSCKPQLLGQLEGADALELDLSGVVEADTTFIQLLLLLHRECEQQHKRLRIISCGKPVNDLVHLYGLAPRLLPEGRRDS